MTTPGFWELTEKAQGEITRLQGLISNQRAVIAREEAVQSQKGDTYICTRAKNSLESHSRKLENVEVDYKRELEQLEMRYRQDKALLEKNYKDSEAKHSAAIQTQEAIIHSEMTRKTATVIRAETDIATLQQKIDAIRNNQGNFPAVPKPIQPPLTQAPSVPEVSAEPDDDDNGFRAFMTLDFNKPEKPLAFIDNNYSYCTTKEANEINKGLQGLVPAATSYDSNIYGPVSDLSRKKQVKQAGVKA